MLAIGGRDSGEESLSHSLTTRLISYSRFVITIFYHQIAHFYSIHFASVWSSAFLQTAICVNINVNVYTVDSVYQLCYRDNHNLPRGARIARPSYPVTSAF